MRGQDSATLYLHSPPRRLGRWRGGLLCFACAQGRLSTSGRGAPIGDRPAAASVGQTAASRPDGLQSGGAVATPWVSPCALACRVGVDGRLRLSPSRRRDVALAPVTCVVACARSRRCFPRRLGGCSWPCRRRASRGSTRHAPRLHGPCCAARTSTSTSYDDDNTITFHRPRQGAAGRAARPRAAQAGDVLTGGAEAVLASVSTLLAR